MIPATKFVVLIGTVLAALIVLALIVIGLTH